VKVPKSNNRLCDKLVQGNIFIMRQQLFYYLNTTISPAVKFRQKLMEYSRQLEERGAYFKKLQIMEDLFEIKEVSTA